ncbi:hypothetical protein TSAR_012942 [Trichomalopsis sarcophagae]|uniref:Uncharacterized protein n=1 Tax=Trichomalopsis sarcophagae TaxID=543379 RepID=A0A232FFE9_9HYME|nr:hypothetical protein TSAR_012942 [Trichomalopsis sarcophagae]
MRQFATSSRGDQTYQVSAVKKKRIFLVFYFLDCAYLLQRWCIDELAMPPRRCLLLVIFGIADFLLIVAADLPIGTFMLDKLCYKCEN